MSYREDWFNRGFEGFTRRFPQLAQQVPFPRFYVCPLRDQSKTLDDPWDTSHRWEWFRRSRWQGDFRARKRMFASLTATVLRERGRADGLLLDCSCGLGLFTIVFAERGLRVQGADRSAFAVERARDLAREEGQSIPFHVCSWNELATRRQERFDAMFCDALMSLPSHDDFVEALRALRAALGAGGLVLFPGATQGSTDEQCRQMHVDRWQSHSEPSIEWRHTEGDVTCTKLSAATLGDDYIERQHIYLVEEAGVQRIESTSRLEFFWSWTKLRAAFEAAGFSDLSTCAVERWPGSGLPVGLNVATL